VVVDVPSLASFAYQLNTRKAPFDKKPLRQALAYAVDTEALVRVSGSGRRAVERADRALLVGYDDSIKPIKRDVARAKQLLAEGGMPNGYSFTLTTNTPPLNVQEAEAIKAMLAEVGIQMEIKPVDDTTLLANGNAGQFDMIGYQWSGRPDPDGNTFQFFKSAQGPVAELGRLRQPEGRRAARQDPRDVGPGERKTLYSELVRRSRTTCPGCSSSTRSSRRRSARRCRATRRSRTA
jgi:ABC-type transport system substrate-binding protein